jgi:DNA-binding NarL/FixJ family response regulator
MIGEAQDDIRARGDIFCSQNLSDALSPSLIIIETRALIRECLAMCLQKKLGLPVLSYPDVASWSQDATSASASACVIILSGVDKQIDSEQTELIRELSQWEKEIPVVVFCDNENRSQIANSLRCGAKGYIPSDTPLEVVARAIKLVLVGGVFVPANVVLETSQQEETAPGRQDGRFDFTARENDVVKALLKGKSNKVIAYELSMSESSVKVHIRNVMRKLQVRNRTEAVIKIAEIVRGQSPQQEEEPAPFCA